MIPELGQLALILALCVALVQATLPLAGSYTHNPAWLALARPAAGLQLALLVSQSPLRVPPETELHSMHHRCSELPLGQ